METVRTGACCAVAAAAVGGLVPVPIGHGQRYRPSAHGPAASLAGCRPAALRTDARVHLELFANRRVVIVPAAIGLAGATVRLGRVSAARCRAAVWTLDPSGVVGFEPGSDARHPVRRLGPPARADPAPDVPRHA